MHSQRITYLTCANFDILVLYDGDSTNTEILRTCFKSSIAVTGQKPSILWQFMRKKGALFVHKLACSAKNLPYNQHQQNF